MKVPDVPKRIVALHDASAAMQVKTLGFELVGACTRGGEWNNGLEFVDMSKVKPIGECYEPSVEAILALKPDLIVGEGADGKGMDEYMGENIQKQLEAAAPVVYISCCGQDVEDHMSKFAELLGPRAQAEFERQQAAYRSELAKLRTDLGPKADKLKVTTMQMEADRTFGVYGRRSTPFTQALDDLGIDQPSAVDRADKKGGYDLLSWERLRDVAGDVILTTAFQGKKGGVKPYWTTDPVFQSLKAVESGQAHSFNNSRAYPGTFKSLEYILAFYRQHLVDAKVDASLVP